jgi:hypothetical protein
MLESEKIKEHHQQLVATIEDARSVIRGAVKDFLKDLEDAERLCQKAQGIAKEWNGQAEHLVLPEEFMVTGWGLLADLKKSVARLDVQTPTGALSRKPLTAEDLAPRHLLPGQRRKVA